MKYLVDVDDTICYGTESSYYDAKPHVDRIKHFNELYDQGHEVHYWTARGSSSGLNWYDLTLDQLKDWGVKFHSFNVGKPTYDVWIDDKAVNVDAYFTNYGLMIKL